MALGLNFLRRKQRLIVVIENPELGFFLGPKLAQVLRIPHFQWNDRIPNERAVVSLLPSQSDLLKSRFTVDLTGNFSEYLTEGMTRGVDPQIEALRVAMMQLVSLTRGS